MRKHMTLLANENAPFVAELNDKGAWTALNYLDNFEKFQQFDDNCERIDANNVSCDEFIERYEKIYKPVVIEGTQVRIDAIASNECANYLTTQFSFSITFAPN